MTIAINPTPNPRTMRFGLDRPVAPEAAVDFSAPEAARGYPAAEWLFALPGVTGLFFGTDFVSVTAMEGSDWAELAPAVAAVLERIEAEGLAFVPAGRDVGPVSEDGAPGQEEPVVARIREIVETRIRPAVAQDGGDIVFRGFEDGVVSLEMRGACAGCPSSALTLKSGIESMLCCLVPEVVRVQEVS